MSADPDNQIPDNSAELEKLQNRLHGNAEDEAMLVEVGTAIRSLLSGNAQNESLIQSMLQKQFADGHLRKESYELMQNLLGKIATEERVRSPIPESASLGAELFAQTDVIDEQAQAQQFAQVQNVAKTQKLTRAPEPQAPETQLQVGSVLRDRFLLKEKVSEGSMGVVYKALDKRLAEAGEGETSVAIKVLSPQLSRNGAALRALQQEAAKGRCLTHPNIVRFIDLDREGELYFIVMEWLDGRSLSSILDENKSTGLDLQTAMDIVRQTARALEYAHQRGVIHADIKPGNIIITPSGEVKLIDFGVARVRQKENEGKSRFDPAIMRAGTPAYSSMQVLTGENPVAADDVFSLACLLYRLVAGYRVFGPRNAAQAAEDGMEPQQPQGLPDPQWLVLKKALAYSRVTRFESIAAFVKALGIKSDVDKGARAAINVAPIAKEVVAAPEPTAPAPIVKEPAPSIQNEHVFPSPARKESSSPVVAPIRADKESIMFDIEDEDDLPRRSAWRLMVIGAIIIGSAAVVATRTDLVDQIGESVESVDLSPVTDVFDRQSEIIDVPAVNESTQDVAEFVADDDPSTLQNEDGVESSDDAINDGGLVEETNVDGLIIDDATINGDRETLVPDDLLSTIEPEPEFESIDYSTLPLATVTVNLSSDPNVVVNDLIIREDSGSAIVDIFRVNTEAAQTFQISEAEFSGNQSPWQSGIYSVTNDGEIYFSAGQERARLTISMRSNPVREPDRDVVLRLRDVANSVVDIARINLQLEDDDQRAFERGLPRNTVAFAVNQVSVREFDAAVQIDVIRYNADNTTLEVGYILQDVTATEGQDYFTPGSTIIYFAAGQRTARILVPLGQDARPESDEAFLLELETRPVVSDSNIFSQIAVMIRDDDS
jgi:serine/threonine protein kinase